MRRTAVMWSLAGLVAAFAWTYVATGAQERVVMRSTLSGRAGETIACLEVDSPSEYVITFPKQDAKVRVTIVRSEKGIPDRQQFDNDGGTLPMIAGRIKKLTVEFRTAGVCEVLVHEARKP